MSTRSRITIRFDETHVATAIQVKHNEQPARVLTALELPNTQGIVVVHGGAGNMETEMLHAVRQFLIDGLAPLAEAQRLLIVDGGTQSGVSQLMGEARQHIRGTYPLLGVAPLHHITYPGDTLLRSKDVSLNAEHTHFVLVEDTEESKFGIESELLVGLIQASGKPGLALIINGGEIVFKEVLDHAARGNILVTLRGSGRIADKLADPTSAESEQLPPDTRLHVADIHAPQSFMALVKRLLLIPTS